MLSRPARILGTVVKKPRAVLWYKVYCYLFAALNFYSAWHGLTIVRDPDGILQRFQILRDQVVDDQTRDLMLFMIGSMGWTLLLIGAVFGVTAFSLPNAPDNRKTWVAHLVHIVVGTTSCVLTPFCIVLLVAWLKPEVKEHFGVLPRER